MGAFHYLLNPPSWSVGVELTFYLCVLFLNRCSSIVLGFIAGVSILLRMWVYVQLDWTFDPWTYRFFPFELSQFLLGMLCCRMYLFLSKNPKLNSSMNEVNSEFHVLRLHNWITFSALVPPLHFAVLDSICCWTLCVRILW